MNKPHLFRYSLRKSLRKLLNVYKEIWQHAVRTQARIHVLHINEIHLHARGVAHTLGDSFSQ